MLVSSPLLRFAKWLPVASDATASQVCGLRMVALGPMAPFLVQSQSQVTASGQFAVGHSVRCAQLGIICLAWGSDSGSAQLRHLLGKTPCSLVRSSYLLLASPLA